VHQALPVPADVDIATTFATDRRVGTGRPWLLVNMISSLDGATAVQGVSGSLGGPADRTVFLAIRAVADVILVGAATVRAETYSVPMLSTDRQTEREARGQAPRPRLAIVSRSLDLDLRAALFSDPAHPPFVVTTTDADVERRAALAKVAEIIEAGTGSVDLLSALDQLRSRGVNVVLSEGGPTLNGQLVAAGLVDEMCLSLSPMLVGGSSRRLAEGPIGTEPLRLILDRVVTEDGFLFLRYLRTGAATGTPDLDRAAPGL
jgi:riboflavin-specific deaminase-like protein